MLPFTQNLQVILGSFSNTGIQQVVSVNAADIAIRRAGDQKHNTAHQNIKEIKQMLRISDFYPGLKANIRILILF